MGRPAGIRQKSEGVGLLRLALALALVSACSSETPSRILVIVNAESPVSVAIGKHYAELHDLPAENFVRIWLPVEDPNLRSNAHESTSRTAFETQIRDPIEAHLMQHELRDQIEILLTTKGVPLRIEGDAATLATWLRDVTRASVDAELMLLFSDLDEAPGIAQHANAYYGSRERFSAFRLNREAEHRVKPRYLSARLTGRIAPNDPPGGVPTSVLRLLDAANAEPKTGGRFVIDSDPSHTGAMAAGDRLLLEAAAGTLAGLGLEAQVDRTPEFRSDLDRIAGYASWGSNDHHDAGKPYYGLIGGRTYPGAFEEKSVAIDFVSTSARTFSAEPHYGQSLVADLLALGAAGVGGHVAEPTLSGVHRPHLFFERYASGAPAIEAYWASVPYLGWMNTWVGDPLLQLDDAPARKTDDLDGDGVANAMDNCTRIPNPKQRDTDRDNFGNACDPDVNNNLLVTTSWGSIFPLGERGDIEWIALTVRSGRYDENHDLDGNGAVDAVDISIAQLGLFHPPGPSGTRPD